MQYGQLVSNPGDLLHAVGRQHYADFIAYTSFLKEQLKRDISSLDLASIPGLEVLDGKLKISEVNKSALNRAISELPERVTFPIPSGLEEYVKVAERQALQGRIEVLRNTVQTHTQAAERSFREGNNQLAHAARLRMELTRMEGSEIDLFSKIRAVVEAGFWRALPYDRYNDMIVFETGEDLWVNFNDAGAQINRSYNAGKFKVMLYVLDGLRMKIRPVDSGRTPMARDHYHPHVSRGGELCLGNAAASYTAANQVLDMAKMMDIARIILTTYSPDSPYVRFDEFMTVYERQQSTTLRTINTNAIQQQYANAVASRPNDIDWYDSQIANF